MRSKNHETPYRADFSSVLLLASSYVPVPSSATCSRTLSANVPPSTWQITFHKYIHFLRVNEQRNILHEIRKRKANWIGHILRRNCLLQQVTEGKIKGQIEVTRRRGRKRKKLLDDLKDRRGYCQLKEEALDRTMWRNHSGRGFGPVVWQIPDDDDNDTVLNTLTL